MRLFRDLFLLITISFFIFSCSKTENGDNDPSICPFDVDTMDFSFGIDYNHPENYLIPGEQSDLSAENFEIVQSAIGTPSNNVYGVKVVCDWINRNFTFDNAGGGMAGLNTVNELFEIKKFYGCHSLALIISSVLRGFGIPAVMIETVDVKWGYDYRNGFVDYFKGHVMSEVYINNKWILLDNNGTYVDEYDYTNPYITGKEPFTWGFLVFAKGVDIWDYQCGDDSLTDKALLDFTNNVDCYESLFYTEDYKWSR